VDLDEGIQMLSPAIPGENSIDHDIRLSELCSFNAVKAEAMGDIHFLDRAIERRKRHSIDVLTGGWPNLQGLIALLGEEM
jgi:hypothetical protein